MDIFSTLQGEKLAHNELFYFVLNEETLTRLNLPVYFLTPNGSVMGLDSFIIPHHSRPSQCLRFAMALGDHVLFILREPCLKHKSQ